MVYKKVYIIWCDSNKFQQLLPTPCQCEVVESCKKCIKINPALQVYLRTLHSISTMKFSQRNHELCKQMGAANRAKKYG